MIDIKYTATHEWVKQVSDEEALVGVTDYAQSELGEIVFLEFPEVGEIFGANEIFGSIEAVKTVADLNMPISGRVVAVNEALNDQPELVNDSAENQGWIIRVEIDNIAEFDNLMTKEEYLKSIGK